MEPTDLKVFKGNKVENPLRNALNDMIANSETQLEMYGYIAKFRKEYFDSLVKEGFTEVQALEIVKVSQI